jgi:hypothetical protein
VARSNLSLSNPAVHNTPANQVASIGVGYCCCCLNKQTAGRALWLALQLQLYKCSQSYDSHVAPTGMQPILWNAKTKRVHRMGAWVNLPAAGTVRNQSMQANMHAVPSWPPPKCQTHSCPEHEQRHAQKPVHSRPLSLAVGVQQTEGFCWTADSKNCKSFGKCIIQATPAPSS